MDLLDAIQDNLHEQKATLKKMEKYGIERANAEFAYQTVLSQEVLKERDKGTAIGVITLTCKGKPSVAEKRLKRDIADTMYEVSRETINVLKKELSILDGQFKAEWGSSDNG